MNAWNAFTATINVNFETAVSSPTLAVAAPVVTVDR
jgi:hypothetical protein